MQAVVITGITDGPNGGRPWNDPYRVNRRAIRGPILSHVDTVLNGFFGRNQQAINGIYPSYIFGFPENQIVIQRNGKMWGHVWPNYRYLSQTYTPPVPRLLVPKDLLIQTGTPFYHVDGANAIFYDLAESGLTIPETVEIIDWDDIQFEGWQVEESTLIESGAEIWRARIDAALATIWRYDETLLNVPVYAVRLMGMDWFMLLPWYYPAVLDDESGFQLPFYGFEGIRLAPAELIHTSGPDSPFAPGNYVPRLWGEIRDTDLAVITAQMSADAEAHRNAQLARMNELGAGAEVPSYAFAPKAFFSDTERMVKVQGIGSNEAQVTESLTTTGRPPRNVASMRGLYVPGVRAKAVAGVTEQMIQAAHDQILAEIAAAQGGTIPTNVDISEGGNVGRNPTGPGRNPTETRIGYADPSPDGTWDPNEILEGEGAQTGSFGEHGGGGGVSTGQVLGFAAQIMAWYEQGSAGAVDPKDVPEQLTAGGYVMGVMEGVSDFRSGDYLGGACAAIAVAGSALQQAKILDRSFPWKAFASSVAAGAAAGASIGAVGVVTAPIVALIGAVVGAIACVIGWLIGRNPRGQISGVPYAKGVPAWAKCYAPQAFIDWVEDMDMMGLFNTGVEECQQALLGWTVDELGHVLDPVDWAGAFDPDAWTGVAWSRAWPYPHGGGQISDDDKAAILAGKKFTDYSRSAWVYQTYRALGINYEESLTAWRATGQKGFVYIDQKVLTAGEDGGWMAAFGGAGAVGGLAVGAVLAGAAYMATKKR